ncbi:MAG: hypothetical protein ACHBN1_21150 [Heteroscytonema crispum UTEX LB 1556]
MVSVAVPYRPFSTELITGLMVPDGFFVTTLGQQNINAHFKNLDTGTLSDTRVYLESVDDPGIAVESFTHYIPSLGTGVSRLLSWKADFSAASPGKHLVSFIAENSSGRTRIIKKIFVTRVTFNSATNTFNAEVPEGSIQVHFNNFLGAHDRCCGRKDPTRPSDVRVKSENLNIIDELVQALKSGFNPNALDIELCLPGYLLQDAEIVLSYNPPFAGQYGPLPFQDPWWKVLLWIIFAVALIAAAVVAAVFGGPPGVAGAGVILTCCAAPAAEAAFAGAIVVAGGSGIAAGAKDERDPFRRGQDNTLPSAGELTTGEQLKLSLSYPEPVALGRPFAVGAKWEYTRVTTSNSYTYAVNEVNRNIHVLSEYKITAPDVVRSYKREPFIVKGQFFGADSKVFRGDELFVQCFLVGPSGQSARFVMQDDGSGSRFGDETALDGVYTGGFQFTIKDRGLWTFFVLAQDINTAKPNLTPEEAAKIIGGFILTHQLTINFEGGTCPFVPDGHVNVI